VETHTNIHMQIKGATKSTKMKKYSLLWLRTDLDNTLLNCGCYHGFLHKFSPESLILMRGAFLHAGGVNGDPRCHMMFYPQPEAGCQSYTEQYQHNRQDSRLLRQKSKGRKMAFEREEGRGQSLSFIFLLPDPCIITGH
jgi:hypothetical protein